MSDSLFFSSGDITSQTSLTNRDGIGEDGGGDVLEWTIFREGRFQHPYYGLLDFDTDFLEKMVENHKRNVLQRKVGFDAAHNPSNGATSWIEDSETGLFLQEQTFSTNSGSKTRTFLKARHEPTPRGKQLIEDKIYRYFSSEVDPNYSSGEVETIKTDSGEVESVLEFGPTLIGGGIVMRPYIPNLGQVAFGDDTPLEERAKKDVAVFKSPDEGETGIFMFKDSVNTVIDNNKAKKFFQFSAPKAPQESEGSANEEQPELDKDIDSGAGEEFADIEAPHSNEEQQQGEVMKFGEVLNHVRGLETNEDKINYLEDKQGEFEGGESAEIFSEFLASKKEIQQARAEAEDAVQRKMKFQNRVNSLEDEKVKMANDLREAREGSRQAQVRQFSAELREDGHTEAVVKEVENILTGLPSESYTQTFSVKGGSEDEDLNLNFKGMIERVLGKMPEGAKPLQDSEQLEGNQEFADKDQDGAQAGETAVDPDAGVGEDVEQDAAEDDDSVPSKVVKFSEKQGYFPAEEQWEWIDDNGVMHIGGFDE